MILILEQKHLIAIGGLNHDPYHEAQEKIGRLCRFYIHPQYRRKGIGAYLLEYIEQYAKFYFCELHLFSDTCHAACFSQSNDCDPIALLKTNF